MLDKTIKHPEKILACIKDALNVSLFNMNISVPIP